MLQFKILKDDTRNLLVPVSVQKIVIDAKKHLSIVKNLDNVQSGNSPIRSKVPDFHTACNNNWKPV